MNHSSLTSERETLYFVLAAIFSGIIYIIALISIIGIGIALALLVVLLYVNALMLGSIRGNGVRINEQQFPDVYERVIELSNKMGLKNVPEVFVVHSEGALNAFATRFFGRNMVVIYSEVFELARQEGKDELDFIIAHELSHIKRRHVWKNILIMPAQFIPFLSQAYSRACEYTCDREAAYIIQNGPAAKRALTILGIGKVLYREVNEDAYLQQIQTESNGAVWLSEVLSTHPRLPKRIQAVGHFMKVEGTPLYFPNNGKIVLGAGLLFGGVFGAYIAVLISMTLSGVVYGSLLAGSDWLDDTSFADGYDDSYDEMADFEDYDTTGMGLTPLMEAVNLEDVNEIESLIESGADLEETDTEGSTALMYTIYMGNPEIAETLLDAGADPNTEDIYTNALAQALFNEDYDIARLLYNYGADPSIEDSAGDSGFSLLGVDNEDDFVKALENQY
ncbi:M48 family metallopeptidase [Jeotgalibacillus soli]|uniref:Peptidase M48 domain-containing protein n=1 Tax=Jeotgalibacillus soli TaxID=889306 RepID=A0A0C2W720_9BACL|nr:M48 family metallopeptidase [Jeotgalibacillus soli]KIL51828.1 hypothetical protein KP78_01980 [Jeotgalibacillus soli]